MDSDTQAPEGLFASIIRRLGFEKQLQTVRRHFGLFLGALVFFGVCTALAIIGFHEILAESDFGPYVSLALSEPGMAFRYWHSFGYVLFESFPALAITLLFASLAFLILFIRLAVVAFEKLLGISQSIKHNRYVK